MANLTGIPWTLDHLKTALAERPEITAWIITLENLHRRERYFLLDRAALGTDQDRDVRQQNISAKIFVGLPRPGRHGEISKKLSPARALGPQLDAAVAAAQATDHQAWRLPTQARAPAHPPKTADPRMAEDLDGVMNELTDRIRAVTRVPRATTFNSAELFLSNHDREWHLSNGLVHRESQSRIYVESAYSFAQGAGNERRSDEYLSTCWSVSLDDLPIEKLFDETSDRAEHSLDVAKPATGRYPVIVDAEVLATLLNGHVGQLSAAHAYHALPFIKLGDEFIPEARGDLLTIRLDPALDYGADSTAISEQGVPQAPLALVEKNRVTATTTEKQYADYLGIPATTVRGNLVIEPGRLSYADLTRQAPQVIEILQFSGLFADPNSGTFSSEIRLAKLHDNARGTVTYLKGGSLSGSVRDNFRGLRLSDRAVKHAHFSSGSAIGQGYFGPEFALLSDVSIVG